MTDERVGDHTSRGQRVTHEGVNRVTSLLVGKTHVDFHTFLGKKKSATLDFVSFLNMAFDSQAFDAAALFSSPFFRLIPLPAELVKVSTKGGVR